MNSLLFLLAIFLGTLTLVRKAQNEFFHKLDSQFPLRSIFPFDETNIDSLKDSLDDGNIQRVVNILQNNIKQWSFIESQLLEPNVNLGMPEIFIPLKHLTTTLEILGNVFFIKNQLPEAKDCLERACPLMELLPVPYAADMSAADDASSNSGSSSSSSSGGRGGGSSGRRGGRERGRDRGREDNDGSVGLNGFHGENDAGALHPAIPGAGGRAGRRGDQYQQSYNYADECYALLKVVYYKLYGSSVLIRDENGLVDHVRGAIGSSISGDVRGKHGTRVHGKDGERGAKQATAELNSAQEMRRVRSATRKLRTPAAPSVKPGSSPSSSDRGTSKPGLVRPSVQARNPRRKGPRVVRENAMGGGVLESSDGLDRYEAAESREEGVLEQSEEKGILEEDGDFEGGEEDEDDDDDDEEEEEEEARLLSFKGKRSTKVKSSAMRPPPTAHSSDKAKSRSKTRRSGREDRAGVAVLVSDAGDARSALAKDLSDEQGRGREESSADSLDQAGKVTKRHRKSSGVSHAGSGVLRATEDALASAGEGLERAREGRPSGSRRSAVRGEQHQQAEEMEVKGGGKDDEKEEEAGVDPALHAASMEFVSRELEEADEYEYFERIPTAQASVLSTSISTSAPADAAPAAAAAERGRSSVTEADEEGASGDNQDAGQQELSTVIILDIQKKIEYLRSPFDHLRDQNQEHLFPSRVDGRGGLYRSGDFDDESSGDSYSSEVFFGSPAGHRRGSSRANNAAAYDGPDDDDEEEEEGDDEDDFDYSADDEAGADRGEAEVGVAEGEKERREQAREQEQEDNGGEVQIDLLDSDVYLDDSEEAEAAAYSPASSPDGKDDKETHESEHDRVPPQPSLSASSGSSPVASEDSVQQQERSQSTADKPSRRSSGSRGSKTARRKRRQSSAAGSHSALSDDGNSATASVNAKQSDAPHTQQQPQQHEPHPQSLGFGSEVGREDFSPSALSITPTAWAREVAADLEAMLRRFVISGNSLSERRAALDAAREYFDVIDTKFPDMSFSEYAANMDLGVVFVDVMARIHELGFEVVEEELSRWQQEGGRSLVMAAAVAAVAEKERAMRGEGGLYGGRAGGGVADGQRGGGSGLMRGLLSGISGLFQSLTGGGVNRQADDLHAPNFPDNGVFMSGTTNGFGASVSHMLGAKGGVKGMVGTNVAGSGSEALSRLLEKAANLKEGEGFAVNLASLVESLEKSGAFKTLSRVDVSDRHINMRDFGIDVDALNLAGGLGAAGVVDVGVVPIHMLEELLSSAQNNPSQLSGIDPESELGKLLQKDLQSFLLPPTNDPNQAGDLKVGVLMGSPLGLGGEGVAKAGAGTPAASASPRPAGTASGLSSGWSTLKGLFGLGSSSLSSSRGQSLVGLSALGSFFGGAGGLDGMGFEGLSNSGFSDAGFVDLEMVGNYFDSHTLQERNRLLILCAFDIALHAQLDEPYDLSLGFAMGIIDNDKSIQHEMPGVLYYDADAAYSQLVLNPPSPSVRFEGGGAANDSGTDSPQHNGSNSSKRGGKRAGTGVDEEGLEASDSYLDGGIEAAARFEGAFDPPQSAASTQPAVDEKKTVDQRATTAQSEKRGNGGVGASRDGDFGDSGASLPPSSPPAKERARSTPSLASPDEVKPPKTKTKNKTKSKKNRSPSTVKSSKPNAKKAGLGVGKNSELDDIRKIDTERRHKIKYRLIQFERQYEPRDGFLQKSHQNYDNPNRRSANGRAEGSDAAFSSSPVPAASAGVGHGTGAQLRDTSYIPFQSDLDDGYDQEMDGPLYDDANSLGFSPLRTAMPTLSSEESGATLNAFLLFFGFIVGLTIALTHYQESLHQQQRKRTRVRVQVRNTPPTTTGALSLNASAASNSPGSHSLSHSPASSNGGSLSPAGGSGRGSAERDRGAASSAVSDGIDDKSKGSLFLTVVRSVLAVSLALGNFILEKLAQAERVDGNTDKSSVRDFDKQHAERDIRHRGGVKGGKGGKLAQGRTDGSGGSKEQRDKDGKRGSASASTSSVPPRVNSDHTASAALGTTAASGGVLRGSSFASYFFPKRTPSQTQQADDAGTTGASASARARASWQRYFRESVYPAVSESAVHAQGAVAGYLRSVYEDVVMPAASASWSASGAKKSHTSADPSISSPASSNNSSAPPCAKGEYSAVGAAPTTAAAGHERERASPPATDSSESHEDRSDSTVRKSDSMTSLSTASHNSSDADFVAGILGGTGGAGKAGSKSTGQGNSQQKPNATTPGNKGRRSSAGGNSSNSSSSSSSSGSGSSKGSSHGAEGRKDEPQPLPTLAELVHQQFYPEGANDHRASSYASAWISVDGKDAKKKAKRLQASSSTGIGGTDHSTASSQHGYGGGSLQQQVNNQQQQSSQRHARGGQYMNGTAIPGPSAYPDTAKGGFNRPTFQRRPPPGSTAVDHFQQSHASFGGTSRSFDRGGVSSSAGPNRLQQPNQQHQYQQRSRDGANDNASTTSGDSGESHSRRPPPRGDYIRSEGYVDHSNRAQSRPFPEVPIYRADQRHAGSMRSDADGGDGDGGGGSRASSQGSTGIASGGSNDPPQAGPRRRGPDMSGMTKFGAASSSMVDASTGAVLQDNALLSNAQQQAFAAYALQFQQQQQQLALQQQLNMLNSAMYANAAAAGIGGTPLSNGAQLYGLPGGSLPSGLLTPQQLQQLSNMVAPGLYSLGPMGGLAQTPPAPGNQSMADGSSLLHHLHPVASAAPSSASSLGVADSQYSSRSMLNGFMMSNNPQHSERREGDYEGSGKSGGARDEASPAGMEMSMDFLDGLVDFLEPDASGTRCDERDTDRSMRETAASAINETSRTHAFSSVVNGSSTSATMKTAKGMIGAGDVDTAISPDSTDRNTDGGLPRTGDPFSPSSTASSSSSFFREMAGVGAGAATNSRSASLIPAGLKLPVSFASHSFSPSSMERPTPGSVSSGFRSSIDLSAQDDDLSLALKSMSAGGSLSAGRGVAIAPAGTPSKDSSLRSTPASPQFSTPHNKNHDSNCDSAAYNSTSDVSTSITLQASAISGLSPNAPSFQPSSYPPPPLIPAQLPGVDQQYCGNLDHAEFLTGFDSQHPGGIAFNMSMLLEDSDMHFPETRRSRHGSENELVTISLTSTCSFLPASQLRSVKLKYSYELSGIEHLGKSVCAEQSIAMRRSVADPAAWRASVQIPHSAASSLSYRYVAIDTGMKEWAEIGADRSGVVPQDVLVDGEVELEDEFRRHDAASIDAATTTSDRSPCSTE